MTSTYQSGQQQYSTNKLIWSKAIYSIKACSTQKLVLSVLATFADNDGGRVFPSVKTIGELASLKPRAVRYNLKWLREAGFIIPQGQTSNGTVIYQIDIAKIMGPALNAPPPALNAPPPALNAPPPALNAPPPALNAPPPALNAPPPATCCTQSDQDQGHHQAMDQGQSSNHHQGADDDFDDGIWFNSKSNAAWDDFLDAQEHRTDADNEERNSIFAEWFGRQPSAREQKVVHRFTPDELTKLANRASEGIKSPRQYLQTCLERRGRNGI